jgi:hypothetical protein
MDDVLKDKWDAKSRNALGVVLLQIGDSFDIVQQVLKISR